MCRRQVPCTEASLDEMLKLMDFDRDSEISWQEFHTFISYKVCRGGDRADITYRQWDETGLKHRQH